MLCALAGCGRVQDGRTVLRVADWNGPAADPAFATSDRAIRADFERRHPGVRVEVESIPGPGQYVPKLIMTYVAGIPPDVITLEADSAAVFIDHGLLEDLAPLIRGDSAFELAGYFTNVVDMARRDDRLYAVPLDFTPIVILYNKRIFDEAGVAYPRSGWTRAEFLETALALTRGRAGGGAAARYGLTFSPEMPLWLPWIWAGGSDVLSPDGRHAAGYFHSPATVESIRFLVDLVRTRQVAPRLSATAVAGRDLFRAGEAAMTLTGHWSLIEYRADRMELGVADVPVRDSAPATVIYAAGLAISRASRQRALAWEYLKYMTSADVQRQRVACGLAISANIEVARSREGDGLELQFAAAIPHARAPWGARVGRYAMIEDLGRELMEDLLGSDLPVEPTVSRTAELMEAVLRQP